MITRFAFASLATTFLILSGPVRGQELLLRYSFDDNLTPVTSSGSVSAPGTIIGGSAGLITNTPSGTGWAFSTGNGNNGFITTGTSADPEGSTGDINGLDGLEAFTLTMWINLETVRGNDRLVSDGGAPGTNKVGGFDLLIQGDPAVDAAADNITLNLSVNSVSAHATQSFSAFN